MTLKEVKKLHEKKHRTETGLFFIEGRKSIREFLHSEYEVLALFVTELFYDEVYALCTKRGITPPIQVVGEDTLIRAGTFDSNDGGIAILKQRNTVRSEEALLRAERELVLVLDDIRDPGNMGTIIRTADWFGVTTIVASPTTVDMYNPKVVSSTMGSLTRVEVISTDLESFLTSAKTHSIPSYGAVLSGESIDDVTAKANGLLIMGSESHGIHDTLLPYIQTKITIPQYGKAESLNVAVATGIILSTFVGRT